MQDTNKPTLDGYSDGVYCPADYLIFAGCAFFDLDAARAVRAKADAIFAQCPELMQVKLRAFIPHQLMTLPFDDPDTEHYDYTSDGWRLAAYVIANRDGSYIDLCFYMKHGGEIMEIALNTKD